MFGIPTSTREASTDPHESRRRRRRTGLLAAMVATMAMLVMAIGAPGASAAPWTCSSFGYLFQSPNVLESREAGPHLVEAVDLATGEYQTILETEKLVNAVGYDQVDNYMYGLSQTEPVAGEIAYHLVRINSDGSLEELPWPEGLPVDFASVVGDVDPEGHYWIQGSSASKGAGAEWAEIDLNSEPPTLMASGKWEPVEGISSGADWAWINGALYMMGVDPTTHEEHLLRFDPTTHKETDVTPGGLGFSVIYPATGTDDLSGAVYADASGYLYASYNSTGQIWRIDPVTHQALKIADGPKSGSNDGARCASAPIPTVTVIKTVDGRVRPADQFTVALVNPKGEAVESATTTGTATSASTTNFPASQGKTYMITDAMASGSKSKLTEYTQSIVCKDAAGNTVPTGGTGPNWTLPIADATFYTCNVTNKAEADLSLTKTVTPTPVVPGEEATFNLTVSNKGPSGSNGATVTDPLPKEFTFGSASQGCTEAGGTVTCPVGELAPGASKSFEIKGKVAGSLEHCLENTATVSGGVFDPETKNNKATACGPLKGKADLSITKKPAEKTVKAGGQIMYTLVVENKGPSDATGVKVEDPMGKGLTLVSADPSQGSCSTAGGEVLCGMGHLAAGGSAQVLVTATVANTSGKVSNKAKVHGDQEDPEPHNNEEETTIEVTPGPQPTFDLAVKKTSNVKSPRLRQKVTYTIAVTNNGPDAAPDAKVTDTLNKRVRVISVKPESGTCAKGNPFSCELGTIQAGETVKVKAIVRVTRLGGQRNAASATGSGKDTDPSNNLDVLKAKVKKVKLRLTKVASRAVAHPGQLITYRIKVHNLTKGIATNVRVCDRMPAGLGLVSSKPKGKLKKGKLCWTVGKLGPKATKKYTVVVRALNAGAGRKVNRVTATGPDSVAARAASAVAIRPAPPKPTPVTG